MNYTVVRYNSYLCGLISWDETEGGEDRNKEGKGWGFDKEEKYFVLILNVIFPHATWVLSMLQYFENIVWIQFLKVLYVLGCNKNQILSDSKSLLLWENWNNW